jgi:RNA-directed DNA polymerase
VSAENTARSTLAAVHGDGVRALQHVLYRAARADPGRRFHALRDKVYREDVLQRAWYAVRRNNGAPGIDKTTLADVEEYGVTRLLGELAGELRAGIWRPLPARKVLIPTSVPVAIMSTVTTIRGTSSCGTPAAGPPACRRASGR